jgi:hypothetical protein
VIAIPLSPSPLKSRGENSLGAGKKMQRLDASRVPASANDLLVQANWTMAESECKSANGLQPTVPEQPVLPTLPEQAPIA